MYTNIYATMSNPINVNTTGVGYNGSVHNSYGQDRRMSINERTSADGPIVVNVQYITVFTSCIFPSGKLVLIPETQKERKLNRNLE
jgi:hypothetical protein